MKVIRLSKRRLAELDRTLSGRDKAILCSLRQLRYLTAKQIRQLHFQGNANPTAALRATHREMCKLQGYGIVEALERRIGGIRAGSGAYAWTLTEAGVHLLHLHDADFVQRKRNFEPSLFFLQHTLAVSETYIQLTEVCRRHQLELARVELEPECWRSYTGEDGRPATMKPDMFAVTVNGDYMDNWFIEVDMSTESPIVVMEKCKRYVYYCKTGLEQKQHEVFPLVVWLVGSDNRKNNLQQYLAECREISEASKSIFVVITPDEFEILVCGGVEALIKTKGAECA